MIEELLIKNKFNINMNLESNHHHDTAIILPARLGSVRLPRKVLAKIGDKTMLEWTALNAAKVPNCDMYIACDGNELAEQVQSWGYNSLITDPDLGSGTDRVHAAMCYLSEVENKKYKYIVNVQCDMPFVKPETIEAVVLGLKARSESVDIITPIARLTDENEFNNPNIVKVVVSSNKTRGLYFTRAAAPHNAIKNKISYKHIGIYGFCAESLNKFVLLPQSSLEIAERLEQLRALDNGMKIGVEIVLDYALSVDTEEDLICARNILTNK